MAVFVLDRQKRPLMPRTEKRARLLLEHGRAVVVRLAPFTIRLKLDPGSRVTGLALVRESETLDPDTGAVERLEHGLWFGELAHRGQVIREALTLRRHYRRARRSRKTRYRAPRVLNRTRREGWLPPSLQHRLDTTLNWVERLRRLAPITALSQELVRFDTVQGIPCRHGRLLQRADGYGYAFQLRRGRGSRARLMKFGAN